MPPPHRDGEKRGKHLQQWPPDRETEKVEGREGETASVYVAAHGKYKYVINV
jgi:hypothetical protein